MPKLSKKMLWAKETDNDFMIHLCTTNSDSQNIKKNGGILVKKPLEWIKMIAS